MFYQSIFIGPLAFHITSENELSFLADSMEDFLHPLPLRLTSYDVQIRFVDEQEFDGRPVYFGEGFDVYMDGRVEHRYYHHEIDGSKCYYMHNSLVGHNITIEFYRGITTLGRALDIWRFLFLEKLLLEHDGLILHSSSVLYHDSALLFTAPSGTGKSTQADLWKKYAGAEGLNGDRNILIRMGDTWYCCGLPWHGSSPDCRNARAEILCICMIRQYPEDQVVAMSAMSKIKYLYSEVTKNSWDAAFVEKAFTLLESLVTGVKMVQLNCTLYPSAVECLKKEIW